MTKYVPHAPPIRLPNGDSDNWEDIVRDAKEAAALYTASWPFNTRQILVLARKIEELQLELNDRRLSKDIIRKLACDAVEKLCNGTVPFNVETMQAMFEQFGQKCIENNAIP